MRFENHIIAGINIYQGASYEGNTIGFALLCVRACVQHIF